MRVDPLNFESQKLLTAPLALILFYGADRGLIDYLLWEMRAHLSATSKASFRRVEEAAFLENPSHYLDPDLFASADAHRFVLVEDLSEKNSKVYQSLLTNLKDTTLILTSLKLRTSAMLVQTALKHANMWAVSCYPLEPRGLGTLFQKSARRCGLQLSPEGFKALLPRLAIEEMPHILEKLCLWQEEGTLEAIDVEACLGENVLSETELAYALSGRDTSQLHVWLAQPDTTDPLLGIRQASRHFMNLLQVRSALSQGETLESTLALLSPPIFFKQLPAFKAHLPQWSLPQLMRALTLLARAEIALKKSRLPAGHAPFLEEIVQPA